MAVIGSVGTVFLGVLLLYLLVLAGIGLWAYNKTQDEEDYLVAGRDIGSIFGGATLTATETSAGLFVGFVGLHYLVGVSFLYVFVGFALGYLVSLFLIAPQMRRFGGMTIPDFVAARYRDDGSRGNLVRAVSAGLILLIATVGITVQFTGAGIIFQTLFGVSLSTAILLILVIALIYTVVGGMRASVYTDFLQTSVMLAGSIIVIPLILMHVGGLGQLNDLLLSFNPVMTGWAFSPVELGSMAAAGFWGFMASPYSIVRMYTMQDEDTVRYAIGFNLLFQGIMATAALVMGIGMRVLFPNLSIPDMASVIVSTTILGPVLGALLIGAVLSAILSTIDSTLIVAGGSVAHDIYLKLVNPVASEDRKLLVNRLGVVVTGLIALGLSLNKDILGQFVGLISVLQFSVTGGTFAIILLLGLHWKRGNAWGAITGMVVGFASAIGWHFAGETGMISGGIAQLDPVVPGVVLSFAGFVIASYLSAPPSEEALSRFFKG